MNNVIQLPTLRTIPESEQREFLSSAIQATLTQIQSSVADLHDLLLDQDQLTPEQLGDMLDDIANQPHTAYRRSVDFALQKGISYPVNRVDTTA